MFDAMEILDSLVDALFILSVVLLILMLAGCMNIRGCTISVTNQGGSTQVVDIGSKKVNVPVNATVPLSAQ